MKIRREESKYLDDMIYDLWLTEIKGLGPRGQMSLLEKYGTSIEIYGAGNLQLPKNLTPAKKIMESCIKNDIGIVRIGDSMYPERLLKIDDPPLLLYTRGTCDAFCEEAVAVVGARKATAYGLWAARCLGEKLACHDVSVVSGMAYGIDSSAHRGALSVGGHTIAVLGCGPDICYPPSNRRLMEEIVEKGMIISEFPPGVPPLAINFPRRNRIICGISRCVVVAEAGLGSGSLITTDFALEQGKEVYAVPGNINSIYSIGTNKLIKDGAVPLIRIDDILDELGLEKNEDSRHAGPPLGKDEKQICEALRARGELTVDQLSLVIGKPVRETRPIVAVLEIKGVVESAHGKIFIAN